MTSSFLRFLDHAQRRTTVGRTPLDKWSARHRDLYLATHNIHNRQTSMPPVRFEPTISAGERPQTYALGRAATGTGNHIRLAFLIFVKKKRLETKPVVSVLENRNVISLLVSILKVSYAYVYVKKKVMNTVIWIGSVKSVLWCYMRPTKREVLSAILISEKLYLTILADSIEQIPLK